jgi:hypothetical protein
MMMSHICAASRKRVAGPARRASPAATKRIAAKLTAPTMVRIFPAPFVVTLLRVIVRLVTRDW